MCEGLAMSLSLVLGKRIAHTFTGHAWCAEAPIKLHISSFRLGITYLRAAKHVDSAARIRADAAVYNE